MSGLEIDPLHWAASLGLAEIVRRFPDDAIAAYRDARRDLDDLPDEQPPELPSAPADQPKK